jgi:hypothetical protein
MNMDENELPVNPVELTLVEEYSAPEVVPVPWYANRLLWSLGVFVICSALVVWALTRVVGEEPDNQLEGEEPKKVAAEAPAKEAADGGAKE